MIGISNVKLDSHRIRSDNSVLFKKIEFFKESLSVNEFKEDIEEILAAEQAHFKIHQIIYIDKVFNE